MSERKAVIKNADMSEDMQQDAIDCATQVSNVSKRVENSDHAAADVSGLRSFDCAASRIALVEEDDLPDTSRSTICLLVMTCCRRWRSTTWRKT